MLGRFQNIFSRIKKNSFPFSFLLFYHITPANTLKTNLDCGHDFNHSSVTVNSCLSISRLEFSTQLKKDDLLHLNFAIDPFKKPGAAFANLPQSDAQMDKITEPDSLSWVSNYQIQWYPKKNLSFEIGQHEGVTHLENLSGLVSVPPLTESGWYQTAVGINYFLSPLEGMRVSLLYGNGEGENGMNLDPQQYAGMKLNSTILKGIEVQFAMSYDGNDVGSQAYKNFYSSVDEINKTQFSDKGFSTERVSLCSGLNGDWPMAYGLKLNLCWQKSSYTDLDKNTFSRSETKDLPNENFSKIEGTYYALSFPADEDSAKEKANITERVVYWLSGSYRILAEHFVGFNYQKMDLDSGGLESYLNRSGMAYANLSLTSYSLGFGYQILEKTYLIFDYHQEEYDRSYKRYYFSDHDHQNISSTKKNFLLRLSAEI